MILTYKIKHSLDFSQQLKQAKQVADFAISNRDKLSSKYVKHFGLKSAISNQILRKYGRSKTKKVSKVKLTIPNQSIKLFEDTINIPCLKLQFKHKINRQFSKINQIEIGPEYCYISVQVEEPEQQETSDYIGVDLNTTGHCAVIANPKNGKTLKLGKSANHIHQKYKNTRRKFQKLRKGCKLKTIRKRETNIVRDINHKISKKIVQYAKENKCNIKLEKLTGIRQNKKQARSFKYALNSWSFFQLKIMIEYKAKLQGVKVDYIAPAYTSKSCSKCGLIGNRNGKIFKCPSCGHVDHADCNAAFNIAKRSLSIDRSQQDRDCCEGSTDAPQVALGFECNPTIRTPIALA